MVATILVILMTLVLLLAGPAFVIASGTATLGVDWSRADRASVGLAPDPATTQEAVVQVYAARALSWRGAFGTHPWFAVKPAGASAYTVYEVIGWRVYRGLPAVAGRHPESGRGRGGPPPPVPGRDGRPRPRGAHPKNRPPPPGPPHPRGVPPPPGRTRHHHSPRPLS
ncbi:DUF3750 domain-containing protein, partial [Azospirillum brasilense]|uniref:DUF3750 domain-containing protein n=1 Tax=Azospirillum argentinense TaxID=2970906 RepID=UPI00190E96A6